MKIDLTSLVTNQTNSICINENVIISESLLKTSTIKRLENVTFNGKIEKDYDDNIVLSGVISGYMILPDDITLEDTSYNFSTEIEENLSLEDNFIDIIDILWQNILVEIPLKVRNNKNKNIKLKGDGWRLISEEDENINSNQPFANLSEMLEKGGKK